MMVECICGDCVEVMKTIPDDSVDLVVTSPPYDNLRSYNSVFDTETIVKQLYRILKPGGVIVWIVADGTVNNSETGTSFRQALLFKEFGFNIHDTMIWEKEAFSFPIPKRYRQCFEYMFVFSKGVPKTVNLIADRVNKWKNTKIHGTSRKADGTTIRKSNHNKSVVYEFGVRFNVWHIPSEKNNKTNHPAPFPEQLALDHIKTWSNEGDMVLDPFMGSGTTGKMAILANRNFIGIDISQEYCEMAKKRIERYNEEKLF